jgi:thiol:disulfide interchange protein
MNGFRLGIECARHVSLAHDLASRAPVDYATKKKMGNPARQKIAGVLIAIVAILGVPESSRAEVAELLQKLNLTTYSRSTIPPEFNGRMADGREVSLASQQGKVVLLNFWATWCLECRPEMPALERLHREFWLKDLP